MMFVPSPQLYTTGSIQMLFYQNVLLWKLLLPSTGSTHLELHQEKVWIKTFVTTIAPSYHVPSLYPCQLLVMIMVFFSPPTHPVCGPCLFGFQVLLVGESLSSLPCFLYGKPLNGEFYNGEQMLYTKSVLLRLVFCHKIHLSAVHLQVLLFPVTLLLQPTHCCTIHHVSA